MIRYGINSIIFVSLPLLTFSPLFSFTNVVLMAFHSLAVGFPNISFPRNPRLLPICRNNTSHGRRFVSRGTVETRN